MNRTSNGNLNAGATLTKNKPPQLKNDKNCIFSGDILSQQGNKNAPIKNIHN